LEQAEQRLAERRKLLQSALQDASTAMKSQPPEYRAAYDLYRRVLELDSDNKAAVAGLQEILKQRAQIARLAIAHGEYQLAQAQIERMQQTGGPESVNAELMSAMRAARQRDQLQLEVDGTQVTGPPSGASTAEGNLPTGGALPADGAFTGGNPTSEGTTPAKSTSFTDQSIPAEKTSPLSALLPGEAAPADKPDQYSGPDISERPDKGDGSLQSWKDFLNQPAIISAGDRKEVSAEGTEPSTAGNLEGWKNFLNEPGVIPAGDRKEVGIDGTEPSRDGSLQSWANFLKEPRAISAGDRKTVGAESSELPDDKPASTPTATASLDISRTTKTPKTEAQPEVPITTIDLPGTTTPAPPVPESTVGVESVKIQPARPALDIGSAATGGRTTSSDPSVNLARGIQAYYSGDYRNAFAILHPLAEKDQPRAQFRIGMMYYQGRAAVQNQDLARQWFARALPDILRLAQNNEAWAQADLGTAYELGVGVVRDPERAAKWYQKSARQNYPGAQANLGVLYAKGEGVKYDRQAAIYWLKRAAAQGDLAAKANLKALNAR